MGSVIGIGIVEGAEAIAGIIAGAGEAEGAAAAAEASAQAAAELAGDAAAEASAEAGESESEQAAARAAAEAASASSSGAAFIVSSEEAEVLDLIEKIRPLSSNIAEMFEDFNAELNAMINDGVISEEAAVASQEIADVTDAEIEATGLTRNAFEAFEIEAGPEFEGLSEETQGLYQQLKKLGKKIIDKVKQALLACKKTKLRIAECIIALGETIEFLHKEFFSKKTKFPPNVIPDFSGFDAYQIGTTVAEMTAKGINIYYDKLVTDPALAKNEKAMDILILDAFKQTTDEIHNTLSRRLYGMIRTSKFIKDDKVQKKFDEIFKVYNGKLKAFPYRDPKTKLITYIDETGQKIAYKDVTNLNSVTTFYGTWCGPKSYNDTIPLWEGRSPEAGKVVRTAGTGLLDSFCMAHDCDYSFKSTGDIGRGGWFNQIGDFILISRILHNHHLMGYKERSLAMMTVAWFSTLGTILNTYLHPAIVNFDVRDPVREEKESQGDLFSLLYPKKNKAKPKLQENRIQLQGNQQQQNEPVDIVQRKAFYRGLHDKLRESQVDFVSKNGFSYDDNQGNKNYSNLLQHFDNLRTTAVK